MADKNILQGLKDRFSNIAKNISTDTSNILRGVNPSTYNKATNVLQSLKDKTATLANVDLKECLNGVVTKIKRLLPNLPSSALNEVLGFISELDGKLPKNTIISDDYNRLIDELTGNIDQINAIVDSFSLYAAEPPKHDLELDEMASVCRFIGIPIDRSHVVDEYFIKTGEEGVTPPQIEGKDFSPLKQTEKDLLTYFNSGKIRRAFTKHFMIQFHDKYKKVLEDSGLSSTEVARLVSKYAVNSSEFKTFMLTDRYNRDKFLGEYFINEFVANGIVENIEELEESDYFKSNDATVSILKDKLVLATADGNKVIEQYATRLKALESELERENLAKTPDAKKISDIKSSIDSVKEVGYKFLALQVICSQYRDAIVKYATDPNIPHSTFSLDQLASFVTKLEVDLNNVPKVKLSNDDFLKRGLGEDYTKINETLSTMDFTSFESMYRDDKSPSTQKDKEDLTDEVNKEEPTGEDVSEEEFVDEEELEFTVPPTSNMQLIRFISGNVVSEEFDQNLTSLIGVFDIIRNSSIAKKVELIPNDTKLTMSAWEDIFGFDISEAISKYDTKNDPEKMEIVKLLLDSKKNNTEISLLDDKFKSELGLLSNLPKQGDLSVNNAYVQLVRLQKFAASEGKRIEDYSMVEINKKLAEYKADIDAGNVTDEERQEAEELRKDSDFLNIFIQHEDSASPAVKEVLSNAMEKYANKIKLKEEAKQLPITTEELKEKQYTSQTYAKKYGIVDNESFTKKLKGYNTKYLVKLMDDICKAIKNTKIYTEIKEQAVPTQAGSVKDDDKSGLADGTEDKGDQSKPSDGQMDNILKQLIDLLKGEQGGTPSETGTAKDPEETELGKIKTFLEGLKNLTGGDISIQNNILKQLATATITTALIAGMMNPTQSLFQLISQNTLVKLLGSLKVDYASDTDIVDLLLESIGEKLNVKDVATDDTTADKTSDQDAASIDGDPAAANPDTQTTGDSTIPQTESKTEAEVADEDDILPLNLTLDEVQKEPAKEDENSSEDTEIKSEIDQVIEWLQGHKDAILKTSSLISPEVNFSKETKAAWSNLAALTDSREVLGDVLEGIFRGDYSKIAEIVQSLREDAVKHENINKNTARKWHMIAQGIEDYFKEMSSPDSHVIQDFKDLIFDGEDFEYNPNIDYAKLIQLKTESQIEQEKVLNEQTIEGVIADIAKLRDLVGETEAMWMIGRLATASEVKLEDNNSTQLMKEREYILNHEKVKGHSFSCMTTINPQVFLAVLSSFPNSVLLKGEEEKASLSEEDCVTILTAAAFDSDYNISNNIENLIEIVGQEMADNYIRALAGKTTPEDRARVIDKLQSIVKIPLDYLNNASPRKLAQIMIERGLQNDQAPAQQNNDGVEMGQEQ